ncbi:hypothetical protein CLAIMM_14971 [Cladophialophora immunda]|nr:hypothetical protein CLAIMM_14971 [Cladophialophora immunda]
MCQLAPESINALWEAMGPAWPSAGAESGSIKEQATHLEEQSDTKLAPEIQEFFNEQLKEQREVQIRDHKAIKAARNQDRQRSTADCDTKRNPSGFMGASGSGSDSRATTPSCLVNWRLVCADSYKGRGVMVNLTTA